LNLFTNFSVFLLLLLSDFLKSLLLSVFTDVSGRANIFSGIEMLFSLAALRIISSASATLLLAHSHTTDSDSNLRDANEKRSFLPLTFRVCKQQKNDLVKTNTYSFC